MQGLVDDVMRDLLTRIGGFDECVSEIACASHTPCIRRPTWLKYVPEIAQGNRTFAGVPCTVQLWAAMRKIWRPMRSSGALRCRQNPFEFRLPAPTVNKHQGGAVLLKEPQRIYHIVKTLRTALPEHITLSAKMRLGFEDKSLALENALAIAEGGARRWRCMRAPKWRATSRRRTGFGCAKSAMRWRYR